MANTHTTLVSLFDDVADAIREKDGTTAGIVADTFPERIRGISAEGGNSMNGIRGWKQSNVIEGSKSSTYEDSSLVYANGIWICATTKGIYRSEAGIYWEKVISAKGRNVCYGNGTWLCYIDSGVLEGKGIYCSSDGITWTRSLPDVYFYQLVYENGWFVGVGTKGIYRSSNGVTWEQTSTKTKWRKVAYKDGLWLLMYYDSSSSADNGLHYSYDNCATITKNPNIKSVKEIAAGDNTWVLVSSSAVYYSEDGMSWAESSIEIERISSIYEAVALNINGKWVLNISAFGRPYYSLDDGKTWQKGSSSSPSKNETIYSAYYCSILYEELWMVICMAKTKLLYSADGIHWYDGVLGINSAITEIHHAGGVWVGLSGNDGGIFYSEDFVPVE